MPWENNTRAKNNSVEGWGEISNEILRDHITEVIFERRR